MNHSKMGHIWESTHAMQTPSVAVADFNVQIVRLLEMGWVQSLGPAAMIAPPDVAHT